MGCHGSLNALQVARAFAHENPDARVLVCAVELCSLHMQYGGTYTWNIAVPNDTYRIHIVAGDPSYTDSVYKINAENVTVHTIPPTQGRYVRVVITDPGSDADTAPARRHLHHVSFGDPQPVGVLGGDLDEGVGRGVVEGLRSGRLGPPCASGAGR